jgi:predicted transposase/invertase (TIGR01784 family)
LSDITEIIFYELPKLRQRVREILGGKVKPEIFSEEEKWCIYMRYRHEKRASELIKELCHKEAGIMYAEKAVTKVSRDYLRYARKMAEIKNSMDKASRDYDRGMSKGKTEIAQKMKIAGRPSNEIAEFTGLSTEIIANL